ncbi:MAG: hypothetical protein HYX93_01740 [Chloroflexi bacterium]|nr:hypothetical protein [Chloroflexota bacterium]
MAEASEQARRPLTRREFLARASLGMAAAATLAALARNLSLSPLSKGSRGAAGQSIFTPKSGSRVRFWGRWLNRFRLR